MTTKTMMIRAARMTVRLSAATCVVLASAVSSASIAHAQWSTSYHLSPLRAPYNGEFRERFSDADRLLNAFEYAEALRYEVIWGPLRVRTAALEVEAFNRLTDDVFMDPPRLPAAPGAINPEFAKLVPEAVAMLRWAQTLRRQAYDVLADESSVADREGRLTELVAHYRSISDLAISTMPKSLDVLDAQFHSLAFRQAYPNYNGLLWATRWLESGLFEPLVAGESAADRQRLGDAAVTRFRGMLRNPPETMPYLLPMTPVIAPAFARRYPELAVVFDNLHMLQDVIGDILVAREVPRSAKRQEILRAMALFRSDTAFATTYDGWIGMGATLGAQNMGGVAVGSGEALPQPTVGRGMSVAGMIPRAAALTTAAAGTGMAGMDHGAMTQGQGTSMQDISMETMMAVYRRMMADPVIRERVATDPVIQQLLGGDSSVARAAQGTAGAMPGMDHSNMPGMGPSAGGGAASQPTPAPMSEERRQAIEFAVRLLSDPSVEARIHSDPELHKLWSDPEVQRRLTELRRTQLQSPTRAPTRPQPTRPQPAQPQPTQPPPHNHP